VLLFSAVLASQIAIMPPKSLSHDEIRQAVHTEISQTLSEGQKQITQAIRTELTAQLSASQLSASQLKAAFATPSTRAVRDRATTD
jgi:hypothetical protein